MNNINTIPDERNKFSKRFKGARYGLTPNVCSRCLLNKGNYQQLRVHPTMSVILPENTLPNVHEQEGPSSDKWT